MMLLQAIPFLYSFFQDDKKYNDKHKIDEFNRQLTQLSIKKDTEKIFQQHWHDYSVKQFQNKKDASEIPMQLFYFDPNTLPENDWKRLGLSDKNIHTISNYLQKGGKFHTPEDLKKIWGLSPAIVEKLLPYVTIKSTQENFQEKKKDGQPSFTKNAINYIDINEADSAAWVSLPGIGPGFAKRIIRFRNKLGGFYSVNQVSETFGLPDSVFQKVKQYLQISKEHIQTINLNTVTAEILKEHPYVRYALANAIVNYRLQHGNYQTVNEIQKIELVTPELFEKLAPYLSTR